MGRHQKALPIETRPQFFRAIDCVFNHPSETDAN
jgi:hypothetical protein